MCVCVWLGKLKPGQKTSIHPSSFSPPLILALSMYIEEAAKRLIAFDSAQPLSLLIPTRVL